MSRISLTALRRCAEAVRERGVPLAEPSAATPCAQAVAEAEDAFFWPLLRRLVGRNTHTFSVQGVNEAAQAVAHAFHPLGFERVGGYACTSERAPCGDHLVLRRLSGAARWNIALVSHLDTVYTEEESRAANFTWQEDAVHSRVYGPGVIDIHGGSAMALASLAALQRVDRELFDTVNWFVVCDAAEEIMACDFAAVVDDLVSGKLNHKGSTVPLLCALVYEAGAWNDGRFTLVQSRKGRSEMRLECQGQSAHAGNDHHRGCNAIRQLCRAVERIEDLTDYDRDLTVNIGEIYGGTGKNVVPSAAAASLEIRAADQHVFRDAVSSIQDIVGSIDPLRSSDGKTAATLEGVVEKEVMPWPRNDGTETLLEIFEHIAAVSVPSANGGILREDRGGLSDGNRFAHLGVPVVDGLGPGGGNAHCAGANGGPREFLDTRSIAPKLQLNTVTMHTILHYLKEMQDS